MFSPGTPPSVARPESETLLKKISCTRGEGLPGRVWATGTAQWVGDLAADPGFSWRQEAGGEREFGRR